MKPSGRFNQKDTIFFSDFFSHLLTFGILFHPTLRWLCWIWLHRPLGRKKATNQRQPTNQPPTTDGLDVGASEVEVDNWQFAWAEEQKKGLLQNRGFGEPRKVQAERGTLAVFFEMDGGKNVFDGFFLSFKNGVFFLKTILLVGNLFEQNWWKKGDVHPWILVNDSFRVISCSIAVIHRPVLLNLPKVSVARRNEVSYPEPSEADNFFDCSKAQFESMIFFSERKHHQLRLPKL